VPQTGAAIITVAKPRFGSGGRSVFPGAEQPVDRVGVRLVELRGLFGVLAWFLPYQGSAPVTLATLLTVRPIMP
jgi:hypothetical protein